MGWQPDDAGPSGHSLSPWGCLGPGTWRCACSNTEPGLTRLEKGLESTEHTPGDTWVPAAQRDPGEDQPDQP